MSYWIEDTARNNLAGWSISAHQRTGAGGVIISPWSTPRVGIRYKQGGVQTAERIRSAGLAAVFDPVTHALGLPQVGDFRYYADWPLWPGGRGDLSSDDLIRQHIRRVFAVQDELGSPRLAPTVLVRNPTSNDSLLALRVARLAAEIDTSAMQAIAGDPSFWGEFASLDAHLGNLNQVETPVWHLTVVRYNSQYPTTAGANEVFGLCRASRALSDYSNVHISHGDFAALPAIVAGASSAGTGWDVRQRMFSSHDYSARVSGGDGGSWYQRPSLQVLLGNLKSNELTVLASRDQARALRLTPGAFVPQAEEAFLHHHACLSRISESLHIRSPKDRYDRLLALYAAASTEWPAVRQLTSCEWDHRNWIAELEAGLALYGREEGW